jgi:hypothetical protein
MNIAQSIPLWGWASTPICGGMELVNKILARLLVCRDPDLNLFMLGDSTSTVKLRLYSPLGITLRPQSNSIKVR